MDPSSVWSAALDEAWGAYRDGSVPVGAVFVGPDGAIRHRARNQVYGASSSARLHHTRLAHAEVNLLAETSPDDRLYEGTLYTTLEPCALCVGACVICGIRHIRYAAKDASVGAGQLLEAHPYLRSKHVILEGPVPFTGTVSLLLMTDWILREGASSADRTITAYRANDATAVDLAHAWFRAGRLQGFARDGVSVDILLSEVERALRCFI